MCGIAGIVSKNNNLRLGAEIKAMADILRNRGPDGEGYLLDEGSGVYLGHRRLSIIDLSEKANQPLYNEDRNMALVFNGEIYNYVELRRELLGKGHRFISRTDSEILVHGYEEWGLGLLERINGMFAFCVYDKRNNEIILARDNIGIKPLYYLDAPQIFAFASETRAFLPLRGGLWQPQINRAVLEKMVLFQYVIDTEDTIYSNVKKLPAGHFLRYKNGRLEIKRFWDLRVNDKFADLSLAQAAAECDIRLDRSVGRQLRSDVPVGILLSGGLDSSLVAAAARKYAPQVNTFTATFDHQLDERSYAKICATHVGTRHKEVPIDPLSINNRIEEMIKYYDDLSSFDGGLFTIYLIAEKIKEFGIKVLLVGEGADEVFGGYSWFGLSQAPFCWMPRLARTALYHYAVSRQLCPLGENMRHTMYMDKVIASFGERDIFRQISRFEIERQLPNHFLMKVDHGTMAHSLEARVPYLDKDLVEFAYSISSGLKLRGRLFDFRKNNEKFILRETAKKYLPREIYMRKKRGFSIPMELVLKANQDKVRSYICSTGSVARSLYPVRKLEGLFEFKNTMYSPAHKQKEFVLWRLFLLEVWKRNVYAG